ncbi:MAG: metallophosphoesterase [Candidatus Aenigmarchaeota archaeon]|nr:metallophosphoesterase [Candidatus Aenigmarchaeota archaeon]
MADLHLGIEHELYESGIIIPPQTKKFKKIIIDLIRTTQAKTLVILGDVKHEVPGMSYREMKEIPKLFKSLIGRVVVHITLGNHDSFLKKLLHKGAKIHSSSGFKIGRYGFFHGHAWPSKELMKCDYLFMGHLHPTFQLKDKFGYTIIEPVLVRSEIYHDKVRKRYKISKIGRLKVIIIPAFNRLLGGTSVNVKKASDKLLGPLLKGNFIDIDDAELYLLDGTYLGKISALANYFT